MWHVFETLPLCDVYSDKVYRHGPDYSFPFLPGVPFGTPSHLPTHPPLVLYFSLPRFESCLRFSVWKLLYTGSGSSRTCVPSVDNGLYHCTSTCRPLILHPFPQCLSLRMSPVTSRDLSRFHLKGSIYVKHSRVHGVSKCQWE